MPGWIKSVSKRLRYADLKLLPPAMKSVKTVCLGLNYHDHAAENNREVPQYPMVFFRSASSFIE